MQIAPIPADEADRLAALQRESLLDTPSESEFDMITEMVARAMGVPIALISLVDSDRQWFKSKVGLDVTETSRDASFCAHAVASGETLVVPDTLDDDRFADNPLVVGDPSIRFYAGVPLQSRDGYFLGTLCAIDRRPRELSEKTLDLLTNLAGCVENFLYLRRNLMDVKSDQSILLRLIAMALHDLRNPMTSVSAGIHLLQSEEPSTETQDVISDMALSMESMQRVLMDTLDIALSSTRPLTTTMREVELRTLLEQTAQALRPTLESSDQTLVTTVAEDIGHLLVDPKLIRRAVGNLLLNASKFTPMGSTIELFCDRTLKSVVISVENKGVAMTAAELESAFDLFGNIGTGGNVHGLALAFCKIAAEAHQGQVRAEPRRDQQPGSRLMIELPIRSSP